MTTQKQQFIEKIQSIVDEYVISHKGNAQCKCISGARGHLIAKLNTLVSECWDMAGEEKKSDILTKIKPAIDDFSAMGKTLIKSKIFENTGNEVIENIGYIKSLFLDSLTSKQEDKTE